MATPLQPLSDSRRRRARRAAALAALCAALGALVWAAAPARAITPTTTTFTYTGAEQMFIVPGGVHSIGVVAIGGGGGGTTGAAGGEAADVLGNVSVTPGQTLYIEVGGEGGGGGAGGFNGGANGGGGAGGGGGASDIRTVPSSTSLSVEDTRLIVAAGGGGAGGPGEAEPGGAGGGAGEEGATSSGFNGGGGAGTLTLGGAGGSGAGGGGSEGTLGAGGVGGANVGSENGGGGGGGGLYGGGGGSGGISYGGGGGGGGYSLTSGLTSLSSAAAKVEIKYILVPPTIAITTPANGATYQQGEVVDASYECTPPEGTTVEACEGPVANGAAIDTSTLGPHAFEVEAEDKDGATASEEVTYTVVAPPSISITAPANGATFTQGQAVTAIYSCTPAGGTGVKTCAGPVANGAALDTAALGSHSFEVKAEDLDGGKATQSVTYTVVAAPVPPVGAPDTILGSHPKEIIKTKKKKVKVKFRFSSNVTGASFKCKLDKGAFAPCTSPKSYKVKLGRHTFSVEAVSAGGTDPTPESFSFKVKKKT